jgi:alpha/beta superfamily hydrolase
MSDKHHTEPCLFSGPAGDLEGLVDFPEGAPTAVAVVCHPNPVQGGSMQNKVAYILARAFNDMGAITLRFNFRGVGKSVGTFDDGVGETGDALAGIDWLMAQYPGLPLWLGGFSFGGYVALRAQSQRPVQRLVTVAPAVQRFLSVASSTQHPTFNPFPPPACPWLLVQGDADDVVPPKEVLDWAEALAHPPQLAVLAGAGHFFHGRLNELREAVTRAFNIIPAGH